MILSFDKFERYELPQVTLCNPNSRATEVDGKITITDAVGVLSNPKGMNLKLNFNAPHELSFDYYRHKSSDPIKQSFYDNIYEAIKTDRYIYLTDIGYFTISGVTDSDEDNIDKKSITCKSCEENELATAEGLYLEEGTYYLHTENNDGLLDLFFPKTAGWTIGYIDPSLLTKPYFVEETEVDNGYNFLYTTIQDMFECIVEPDIIQRTISVYSRVYYAEHHLTDIHIAKYNLLKHKKVEENDEDKYTALNVQGKDESLEIRTVNPTGKNVIYNFEPRHSMMSSALQVAVTKWQEKCESVEEEYLILQQGYYNDMQNIVFPLEEDIKVLELQLKEKEQTRDTIVYGDYDKEKYDEIQDNALRQVNTEIQNVSKQISDKKAQLETEKNKIEINYSQPISNINSDCALDVTAVDKDGNTIFTVELLNELMTHIKPTDYVDEYMLVTESMTYPQRFEKAKELMDRAQSQLVKISSGQKTYSIDTRSFLFNKQFKHFSEQLCAGAIIYVETKKDTMEQLHLTGIDINFDEKSTNFTLGNKYDRSDLKALYEDALGQNSKSFSELKYIASIIEDQQKQLDYQRNWIADLRTLTLDNVLMSEDQAIEINNRGLIGRKRKLDENGEWDFDENGNPYFEDEQVKLINNTLVFTEDNWKTASTAVGKIAVSEDDEGNVKYAYGINGQVLIGELILGNNLVLTGTGAGIKITDSNGNNAFYADENGNLVLSGKIFASGGEIGGWSITDTSIESYKYDGDNGSLRWVSLWSYYPKHSDGNQPNHLFTCREYHDGTINGNYTDYIDMRADGRFFAKKAYISGEITAQTGKIGDWIIGSVNNTSGAIGLYTSGINSVGVGMFASGYGSDPAIWAGYTGDTSTPYTCTGNWTTCTNFFVTNDGYMKANNADIKGKIEATTGYIGGWEINGTKISADNGTTHISSSRTDSWAFYSSGQNGTFKVGFDGDMSCETGNIGGWNIGNGGLFFNNDSTGCGLWGTTAHANIAIHAGGNTGNIGGAPFRVYHDGSLVASKATIAGTLQAGSVLGGGKTSNSYRISNVTETSGLTFSEKIGSYGAFVEMGYRYLSGTDGYDTIESASWWDIINTCMGSDRRLKNTIQNIDDNYEGFFNNLKPVTYKLNKGQSNRVHCGFVAQDIIEALDNNNQTTTDFAAVLIPGYHQSQNNDDYMSVRYFEFVALNTWQIQKAKARITDLENTVAELKTQIQTLTAG